MLLTAALIKSMHGIARRSKPIPGKTVKYEFLIAVVSDKGEVHVISTRTGTIRRQDAADQARDDWDPFMPRPEPKRKVKSV